MMPLMNRDPFKGKFKMKIKGLMLFALLSAFSTPANAATITKKQEAALDENWCLENQCIFTVNVSGVSQGYSLCMVPFVGGVSQDVSSGLLKVTGGKATSTGFGAPQKSNSNFSIQLQFGHGCGDASAAPINCEAVNSQITKDQKSSPVYLNTLNLKVVNNTCVVDFAQYCVPTSTPPYKVDCIAP